MADEVTLPTLEEVAALPRWARVAFAARCARRVLPLFKHHWPDAQKGYIETITWAVEVAENAAERGWVVHYSADLPAAIRAIRDVSPLAANTAGIAANAANAAECPHQPDYAFANARNVAFVAGAGANPDVQRDFETLRDNSRSGSWTDDTPVPPWVFGPMWPNGVPEGWPEAEPNERFQVTVGVPEDAKPEQTAEYLNRLHALLNTLNIQNGGAGITIDTIRREQPKEVPVPVGGGS